MKLVLYVVKLRRDLDSDLTSVQLGGCDQRSLLPTQEMVQKDSRWCLALLQPGLEAHLMEKAAVNLDVAAASLASSYHS